MTDLEMLELAARAAGYKKYYAHHLGRDSFVTYDVEYYSEVKGRRVVAEKTLDWNPRDNDGDALRLAVKLRLDVGSGFNLHNVEVCMVSHAELFSGCFEEAYGNDPYAATRRAILRAAAEIEQAKK